jgi:outer membrane protein assembly factor BamA
LFGRAISLGGAAEYQRRERSGRVFLNAPTLFGLPVESLLTLQRSRREFADATFLTDASSVSWEQRSRVGRNLQLSYAYRFERDHTFDTEVPDDPLFPVFDVTANVARLTGSAAFDTRDDPTDSRRGTLLSASVEIAPEALGSEFTFVRQVNQAYHFVPWRGVVFASAARFGLVSPRGGQELLPSELFFVGGPRTIRGAVEDTVGPRDFIGDPAGGRALFVVNHETRFPLFRWFRGVAFVDAGNVFERPGDISLRRFTTSIGAGLRVSTPFALLRGDYAQIVANQGEATPARWTFGIGHSF